MRYQIFLSSTFVDLQPERTQVTQELLKMGQCIPAGMELFGASSLPPWDFIKRVLDVTDYMVLVLGHRYGSSPPEGGLSYTEREYDYATEQNIPVLAFLVAPDKAVLPDHIERDPGARAALASFIGKVNNDHLSTPWHSPEDLAQKVTQSLWKEFVNTPRPGWVRHG